MFTPSFRITNKILSNIVEIEVGAKIVELVSLEKDWEMRLQRENLIRRMYSSLRFLGNKLDLDDIEKIVKDDPSRDEKAAVVALRSGVVGTERDVQQVLNWLNGNRLIEQMTYLRTKFKQNDYGANELSQINSLLGERMVPVSDLGIYRDNVNTSKWVSAVTQAVEVPYQMEDLLGWSKTTTKKEINSLLKAGILFYEILRISPFMENNLLCGLGLVSLVLASDGYIFKKIWSADDELLKNREVFQSAVLSVEKNGGDLTEWLEYFTKSLNVASEKTRIKITNLLGETPIFKSEKGRVISLTERQIVIMEEMTISGEMTIKDIRVLLPAVSDDTILRDIKDLIEKKLIKKKGKTKGAVYIMGKVKSFR